MPKDKTKTSPESLSYCDAAETVLKKEATPLNYRDITKKAVSREFLQTESATPEISMYVSLRSEIKRRQARSEPQRFMFFGGGIFTLVELVTGAPAKETRSAIEQVRESHQKASEDLLQALTSAGGGTHFETMVADLLIAIGYKDVEVIGGKDDQGVDIVCESRDGIVRTRVAIQCKCLKTNKQVGPNIVSTLRDNLSTYGCQYGIIITTGTLNKTAKEKASETGKERIHYIERDELFELFGDNSIGLRCEVVKHFRLDTSSYDFIKTKGK